MLIRSLEDLGQKALEIHEESDVSQIWRDDRMHEAIQEYKQYKLELESVDFGEGDCAGGGCKL